MICLVNRILNLQKNEENKENRKMEYSMKVYPIHFDDCRTEWCVEYPNLKGCVGGGNTIEEAVKNAEASKQVYLKCLENEETN